MWASDIGQQFHGLLGKDSKGKFFQSETSGGGKENRCLSKWGGEHKLGELKRKIRTGRKKEVSSLFTTSSSSGLH